MHTDIAPKYKEDEIVRIVTEKIDKCIQAVPNEFKEVLGEEEQEEEYDEDEGQGEGTG
jgi:hypothetical protein